MNEIKSLFDTVIESIAGQVEKNARLNPEDYQKDGLWYCGKCNTPKQVKLAEGDKCIKPFCACKCEAEAAEKQRQEEIKLARQRRIKQLRGYGFPDKELAAWTFDKDDKADDRLSKICCNYAENFEAMLQKRKGLLFYGAVGTGKTFYSACIVNALIDKGYPCLMTNFSRISNQLFGNDDKQAYVDGLNWYDLVVIDDLATERDTEYMNEIVTMIIDSRYRSGLPLIITTNLTAEELKNPKSVDKQRVYSRLLEMCIPIEVKGKDRRREKLMEDYKDIKDLLGL